MVARAYWSGHLRLSLVTIPIRLFPATTAGKQIALHYVDRETGERVHYQPVLEDQTPVDKERIAKGYEYEKDHYLVLDDADLAKLKLETSKTLELEQFVDASALDPLYYEKPYYVVPDGTVAGDAYAVIKEALAKSGKIGIGRLAIGGKERVGALMDKGRGMMLTTLRSPDEIRLPEIFFSDITPSEADDEQIALAQQLIKAKTGKFDPKRFADRYQQALQELVDAKLDHREPVAEPAQHTARVINLMDALRRSVAESVDKKAGTGTADKRPDNARKKPARQNSSEQKPAKRRANAA